MSAGCSVSLWTGTALPKPGSLLENKIHSNGVVEAINIREPDGAGRHPGDHDQNDSGWPALPIDSGNGISTGLVPIDQIFTKGNILEGSYSMSYKTLRSGADRLCRAVSHHVVLRASERPLPLCGLLAPNPR